MLLFDFSNIRYVTSTHIGEWARDKMTSYTPLTVAEAEAEAREAPEPSVDVIETHVWADRGSAWRN